MNCKFCNRECKSDNSLRNHERLCKENPDGQKPNMTAARLKVMEKTPCRFCGKPIQLCNMKRHVDFCRQNPEYIGLNGKTCPVCESLFFGEGKTCSYGCSNTLFRSGPDNPNWKQEQYRTTCFHYHKKECVICGENNIVEVHHYDENKNNNDVDNLIPLCPTHHQYWHSRYRNLVEEKIKEYKQCVAQRKSATLGT